MSIKKIIFYIAAFFGIGFLIITIIDIVFQYFDEKEFEEETLRGFSEIEFIVPENFEQVGRYHTYSYYTSMGSCRFEILASSKNDEEDYERWFKSSIITDLNKETGTLSSVMVGENPALFVEVKSSSRTENHYGMRSSNYYYHVEFDYYDKDKMSEDNPCHKAEDSLLSSIKLK